MLKKRFFYIDNRSLVTATEWDDIAITPSLMPEFYEGKELYTEDLHVHKIRSATFPPARNFLDKLKLSLPVGKRINIELEDQTRSITLEELKQVVLEFVVPGCVQEDMGYDVDRIRRETTKASSARQVFKALFMGQDGSYISGP